ncbi:MAG: hypothetical protein A2X40_07690 [Elusimicrobia bacterium GWC2_65_9]|nr:MAG: hypothetical protein A2X37_06010 [Elusimicrobia bacterium GWA2_66_18]OGR70635.1 MAG: hypothetical protein A2X40_07690 [Elusimicrobia bacterium GWC2_65_9]
MDVVIPKVAVPVRNAAPLQPAAPPAPETSQDAYAVFDQRDEALIVDALKGRYIEEFVYRFCRRHRGADGKIPPECACTDVVVGLSWLGVQEAAREYKGVMVPVEKVIKKETDDSVEIMCEAIDTKSGSSRIGIASQPKKLRLRTGQLLDDEFATAKAVAKAQRNAIRPLLPVTLIKAWIAAKLKGANTLPAPTPPASAALPPAPSAPPAAMTPAPVQSMSAPTHGNGAWHPSVSQVKRVFGLAFGNNVSRKQIKELVLSICGVEDPALISSRTSYENLCAIIQRGGLPV